MYILTRFLSVVVLAAPAFAATGGCLIQPSSVGRVHEGMTVAQAREVLKPAVLKPTQDADHLPMLSVVSEGLHTMDLYVESGFPIKETAKVDRIRVFDGACATRDGVHPGMPLSEVSRRYGRLTRMMVTDTEWREYADFEKRPNWLEVQVGNGQVGVYPAGKRCTTNYAPSAHIASLWVSHVGANKVDDASICSIPRR